MFKIQIWGELQKYFKAVLVHWEGAATLTKNVLLKVFILLFTSAIALVYFRWLIRCSSAGSDLNRDVWNVSGTGNRPKPTVTWPDKAFSPRWLFRVSGRLRHWFSWIFLARMWNRNPSLGRREGRLAGKCFYKGWSTGPSVCLEVFKGFILTSTSDIMTFKKKWKQAYY